MFPFTRRRLPPVPEVGDTVVFEASVFSTDMRLCTWRVSRKFGRQGQDYLELVNLGTGAPKIVSVAGLRDFHSVVSQPPVPLPDLQQIREAKGSKGNASWKSLLPSAWRRLLKRFETRQC